jgi:hypothetical protein
MQKLYLTILLGPLLLLSACASVDSKGCPRVSATLVAKDANPNGENPRGTTKITISPDTVKVKPGCTFVINNRSPYKIKMSASAQNSAATWLDTAKKTGDLESGEAEKTGGKDLFKYKITVEGVGELDPRARVL